MPGGGWRIGRVGGVPIFVQPSHLLLFLLIGLPVWEGLSDPYRFPQVGTGLAAGLAVATAILFSASILAHELAHAGVSLLRNVPVMGITLYMLGGLTHQRREPSLPVDEFMTTAAGPATTGLVGGAFLILHDAGQSAFPRPVLLILASLADWNFRIAILNLLPAFPLDGGRLVLSGVWRLTGDRGRALQIAARIGQVISGLLIAMGVALASTTGNLVYGLWAAFIGWFLFQAATSARSEGARRGLLRTTTAREIMSAPPPAVPSDMPVQVVTDRYLRGHDGEAFPVVAAGHVVGFVSSRTVRGVQPGRPVREAMAGPEAVIEAEPDERMDVIGERLGERRVQTVLVFDEGRLVGVIEPEDLTRMLRRRRIQARLGRRDRSR